MRLKQFTKTDLPKNWRQEVKLLLDNQKVILSTQQIYDIKRGRVINETLTKKVYEAMKKVSADYKRKQKKIAAIHAAIKNK